MDLTTIPLDQLDPHPANSNLMPDALLDKLVGHIERTDRYPPIIVRPHGERYQILDGHHRVAALRRLDRDAARCVVWAVDDDEAMHLLATLNRLEGQDDPRRRAKLVAELAQRTPLRELASALPESLAQLRKLVELAEPVPPPRPPQPIDQMPQAVQFFLLPEQRGRLEACLRAIGGSREAALMTLVTRAGDA